MATHQHFLRDSDGTLTAVRSPIVWSPSDEIDETDPAAIAAEVTNHREAAGQHDAEILPSSTMSKAMGIIAHINLQQASRHRAAGNEFMAIYHESAAADYRDSADRLAARAEPRQSVAV